MNDKKSKQTELRQNEIIIKDQRIINFYEKNKNLDIERINLLYIDLLENIMTASIESPTIVKELMTTLTYQNTELSKILSTVTSTSETYKNELSSLKTLYSLSTDNLKSEMSNIKSLISNLGSSISTKIYETKDQYMLEIKEILKMKDTNSMHNIGSVLEKQNSSMIDKITLTLNDVIPKSQNKQYDDIIKTFKDDMTRTINKISDNEVSVDKISNMIENKYNALASNIQTYVMNYITQSEGRINYNLDNIKELSNKNNIIQEQMSGELMNYLNKHKSSSSKGTQGENKLFQILNDGFPSAEVVNNSGVGGMGDFMLKRTNKPPILLETKDYTTPVKREEVDKFIRDITNNQCDGIFMSQNSGIVNKEPFQIDIHDNHILIYIHNVDYDISKINLAINTIDTLSDKIVNLKEEQTNIPKSLLKTINDDYNTFLTNREKLVNSLKDYYKKTLEHYNEIDLPHLDDLLCQHFANNKKNQIICDVCKVFKANSLRSIARHKKACNNKTQQKTTELVEEETTSEDISKDNTSKTPTKKTKKQTTKNEVKI
jgi:hypothetical protein